MVRETTSILKGDQVRKKLTIGSSKTADAVSTTYGPYGRNVAITKFFNPPHVTKDGVTVAHEINLEDPIEDIAAQVIKAAAKRTAKEAGDGTTSTTILANAIVQEVFEYLNTNPSKMNQFKKDLQFAGEVAVKEVEKLSKEVKDNILGVAMVASNGDEEIASLVAEVFEKIGKLGVVNVHESGNYTTHIDTTEGIKLDRSHILPVLVGNEFSTKYTSPKILVTNLDINTQDEVIRILQIQEEIGLPLLIICNDISKTATEMFAYNKHARGIPVSIIRGPGIAEARTESCRDIAIATGATFIEKESGWDIMSTNASILGEARFVEITDKETNIIGRLGDPDEIQKRVDFYNEKIESDTQGLAPNFKKRLAMLTAGAAVVYVGGTNEVDIQEKKDRIDDTLRAVRAALEQGVVKGGGFTYREVSNNLPSTDAGKCLSDCLQTLTTTILENGEIIHDDLTDEEIVDEIEIFNLEVVENNIIDPTLVITNTITNSIGAAIMIFSTDCVIVKKERERNGY